MEIQKASERSRSHLNSAATINRTFDTMKDLEKSAENIITRHLTAIEKEKEKDKNNGFDIDDINSVRSFDLNYTPLSNKVILKLIKKEKKIGELDIIDRSNTIIQSEYYVITSSLMNDSIEKGDIVLLDGGNVTALKRIFKGVEFYEVDFYSIAGVYQPYEIIYKRVNSSKKK